MPPDGRSRRDYFKNPKMVYDVIDQTKGGRILFRGFVFKWDDKNNKGTVQTHKKILDLSVNKKTDIISIRLTRCPYAVKPELYREMQFFVVATNSGLEAVESEWVDPPSYHFPAKKRPKDNMDPRASKDPSYPDRHPRPQGPNGRSRRAVDMDPVRQRETSPIDAAGGRRSLRPFEQPKTSDRRYPKGPEKSVSQDKHLRSAEDAEPPSELCFGNHSRESKYPAEKIASLRTIAAEEAKKMQKKSEQEQDRVCFVCKRYEVNVALLPCGHMGCSLCFTFVAECPLCKAAVESELPLRIWSSFNRTIR